MLINGLVIGVVIWLVGVSVKDFACLLVGQYEFIDTEKQRFFNDTMHYYLLRVSVIALLVAALIYILLMSKILLPLRKLTQSTRQMTEGVYPDPLLVHSDDEVGQLSRHFNQMVLTLKQNEQSRKQMLSDVSHELRTPLSNLYGYLEGLSSGMIEGEPELYRSLLDESLHLTRLVEQLHQLAVWESKRTNKSQFRQLSIDELIEAVLQGFELEMNNLEIDCNVQLDKSLICGDEMGLRQVLNNLVSNALRYDRGHWINVKGENRREHYIVTVTNQGNPIPPGQAEYLFDRFFRIDPSRHRNTGGSGLGLSIAKEIVEHLGGQIGLHSDGDVHSFWFSVPLSNASDR